MAAALHLNAKPFKARAVQLADETLSSAAKQSVLYVVRYFPIIPLLTPSLADRGEGTKRTRRSRS